MHVDVFVEVIEVYQIQRNWDALFFIERDLNDWGSVVNNPLIVVRHNSMHWFNRSNNSV